MYDYKEIYDLVEEYKKNGVSWKYTSVLVYEGDKEYLTSTVDGDGNEIKIYKRNNPIIKSINKIVTEENLTEKEVYYKYGNRIFMTAMPQSSIRPRVMEKLKEINQTLDFYSIEYIPKTGKNKGRVYEQFYKGEKSRLLAWLKDVTEEIDGVLYKKEMQGTYWDMTPYMNNLTKEGNVEFKNGKKPKALLQRIISMSNNKNAIILDFFAGSGTTGQAVIELNKEDGGNRKYILCTNNENQICETITYPRIATVIASNKSDGSEYEESIKSNLKYYKTDFIEKSNENLDVELNKHTKELVQLENAVDIDDKTVLIAFDSDDLKAQLESLENIKQVTKVYASRYVMLNTTQKKLLKNIPIEVIPDYYFRNELKEKGLNWR